MSLRQGLSPYNRYWSLQLPIPFLQNRHRGEVVALHLAGHILLVIRDLHGDDIVVHDVHDGLESQRSFVNTPQEPFLSISQEVSA